MIILIVFLMISGGCWNPFDPQRQESTSTPDQFATKEAVISTFILAYNTQNLDLYEQCLSEDFIFVFDPLDRSALDSLGLRDESWGKTREVENTRKIFSGAESINLAFTVTDEIDLDGQGKTYLLRQLMLLTVLFSDQIYIIDGNVRFTIKELSKENWKIILIEDYTRG